MSNVIAIFDIGKTNKKAFLFDEEYRIVFEESDQLPETKDEDGFPCEDVVNLSAWIKDVWRRMLALKDHDVKAVNVSAYGASLVHVDRDGGIVGPLYNYLKPYPEELSRKFYQAHGGEALSLQTASPVLGSLNSGLQLYRLKERQQVLFTQVQYSLHLPQFVVWLLTGKANSDITSLGCHTALWDFGAGKYHSWVLEEGIKILAPLFPSDQAWHVRAEGRDIIAGAGLHDSSAALIPYLKQFRDPFVLISTGTWSISLNPFNSSPLTHSELENDCLCYLDFKGNPVKASRLHAGHEHEQAIKLLADKFNMPVDEYQGFSFDHELAANARKNSEPRSYSEGYYQLMMNLVSRQVISTGYVLTESVARIFVDGGFSKNPIYMNLLAQALPTKKVFAASIPQASALGAAMAIHAHWNRSNEPATCIEVVHYDPQNGQTCGENV